MKAIIFKDIEKVSVENVESPKIENPGDVIVKVACCSICGSDLHVYHGRESGIDSCTVMGHEFTGEIVEKGDEVKNLKVGDRVMSPFTSNCGECFYCKSGYTGRCIKSQLFGWKSNNSGLDGGQAEYVRVPYASSTLLKTPEGCDDEEALLLGDVISTGFYCAKNAEVTPKGIYAIIGAGPIGYMAALGALEYGAERVIVMDLEDYRLEPLKKMGFITLNPSKDEDIRGQIMDFTGGFGVDSVMEAVGSSAAWKLAYDIVRPCGIISSVGVNTAQYLPITPEEIYNKNLVLKSGRCHARHMMDMLTPLVQEKKFPFKHIISHRMHLDQGANAYAIFSKKQERCTKVVLTT